MITATAWTPRAISVRVPTGERRNPIALVRLELGPLILLLGVSRLKKPGLLVRLPMGEGGEPALEVNAASWTLVQEAAMGAVMTDPAAREHLFGPEMRKLNKARSGG